MSLHVLQIVDAVLTCVFLADFQEFRLVASFGNRERDIGHFDFRGFGNNNLVVGHIQTLAYFLHGISENLCPRFFEGAPVAECHTADYGTAADVHIVDIDVVGAVVVESEHIDITDCLADDDTLRPVVLKEFV